MFVRKYKEFLLSLGIMKSQVTHSAIVNFILAFGGQLILPKTGKMFTALFIDEMAL